MPIGLVNQGSPVAAHPLNVGLVSWWRPLRTNQGSQRLFDIKGLYAGTFVGNSTWTSSLFGPSVSFDGSGDYADCGVSPKLELTTDLTLSATFMIRATTGQPQGVIGKSDFSAYGLMYAFGGTSLNFYIGGSLFLIVDPVVFGRWYHVTCKHTNGTGTLFLNGVKVNQFIASGGSNLAINFYIGRSASSSTRVMNGVVADARVWSRAVSDAEARQYYIETLQGFPSLLDYNRRKTAFAQAAPPAGGGFQPAWASPGQRIITCGVI